MSDTAIRPVGGQFATARRGGIGLEEAQFVADKLLEGLGIQTLAKMIGRPASDIAQVAASLPRRTRKPYASPKPAVYFPFGNMPEPRLIDTITQAVAAHYQLRASDLKAEGHDRARAWPRQEAMWLIHQSGQYATTQIGTYFGGRDHSTVFHAIKRVSARLDACLAQAGFVEAA